MLRYINYDIVFQEIPGEITLAINISNCPHRCRGCHSPYLMENSGESLDERVLAGLLEKYGKAITCVCFMGGDAEPQEVERLAAYLQNGTDNRIKTGWYSGRTGFPPDCSLRHFSYIKLGPYIERFGGLRSPTTNQRLYRIDGGEMVDITGRFRTTSLI